MKVLLLLDEQVKLNMRTPVMNECEIPFDNADIAIAYKVHPKRLHKAVKALVESERDITEIITSDFCKTERKFRNTYVNTISYLEKKLNLNSEGLPSPAKPEKRTFDISQKDKELLKKKDVTKLEIAFAKFKPKCKSFAFGCKSRWEYLKNKTYHKKKIPVYMNEYGFSFFALGIKYLALDKAEESSVKNTELFLDEKLSSVKNSNSGLDCSDEFIVKEYDSTVKKLISSHIPLIKDDKREIIRKTVQNVAVVAFVIAGIYLLYNSVYKSAENTAIQSEIQSIYYDGDVSGKATAKDEKKSFKKLKKINDEIVGWINIDHTNIDYPVLYHKEDSLNSQYYLYKDYEENYSDYGSIFIDFRCQQGAKSKNVVMHGHHMIDGSMFSNLLKYGKTSIDMDFYKKSPVITFSTPEYGSSVYKIISVFKTTGDKNHDDFFNYMQGDFTGESEFMNFVYNVRARSMVNCPVDVNENDRLITLSTCSYEVHSNYRTVVVARKVRNGESKKVDVAKATKNKNAYFPSDFYYRFGGTQPKLTSFKQEYKKGNIDWYDGDGKLSGKQYLTGGKFVRDLTTTTTKPSSSSSSKKATSTTKATKPTKPKATKPKATKPKATKPKTTKPKATAPVKPKETKPKATTPKVKYYTVKFLDSTGKVIKTQRVKDGASAKAPSPPKKDSTKFYKYTFVKWNKSYKNVHKNLTIKPIYRATKIPQPKPTQPVTTQPTTQEITEVQVQENE